MDCPAATAVVTVRITGDPNAGDDNTIDICSDGLPVDLFTLLGPNAEAGGVWTPALNSGTSIFNPLFDSAGSFTYTVAAAPPCVTNDTATVVVNISAASNAGMDGIVQLCSDEPPVDLFTIISPADLGGIWTPTPNSGTGLLDPSIDAAGTYTYTIPATATCPAASAEVDVVINTAPNAGEDAVLNICTNDAPVSLLDQLGGTPDTSGFWTPAPSGGGDIFDPRLDLGGNYVYRVPAIGSCPQQEATVTVSLGDELNAGTDATISFCVNDTSADLFDLLGVADIGGVWEGPSSLTNGEAGTFDPTTNAAGVYVYKLTGVGSCPDASAEVTVSVIDPQPALVADGNLFCEDILPTIADFKNNIVGSVGGNIEIYDAITNGNLLADTDLLVDGQTYFIQEVDLNTGCVTPNRLGVPVSLVAPTAPTFADATLSYCLSEIPTVADLNANLLTGNDVVWFDDIALANPLEGTTTLKYNLLCY